MRNFYDLTIVTRRYRDRFEAWAEDNSGATAVEFALIAAPFFFLLFGLLEISLIFIVSTTLEHGLTEASRDIRTGSFQQSGSQLADFEQNVCDELFGLLDCDNQLHLDVRTFQNFAGSTTDSPIDDEENFSTDDFQFNPGSASDIVLIRAYYEWELITPVISRPLSNLSNGNLLIQAGIAFRSEPFVAGNPNANAAP